MVTIAELESLFKAISQDNNQLCEKVNSIEAKLKELSAMKGTSDSSW
jgi:Skp family chaperone for outer membrane proteins